MKTFISVTLPFSVSTRLSDFETKDTFSSEFIISYLD